LSNSPKITFKSSYPVIPSRRSEISRFLADTGVIMQNIKDIDLKGISDQLKNTSKAIENFVEGKRINNIMTNLESTSANLDQRFPKSTRRLLKARWIRPSMKPWEFYLMPTS
jgi:phospholipid/cholesterol/gamma-HCH transport system substrate-binding protein